ncbi:MAG: glycosyltransferase family 4 protein [Magnetococcales bacterium]|nr:glycosyltransferase family 4 protein [Magnetococcales bacterium]
MGSSQERLSSAGEFFGLRVAYLMSRFPKITETFILYEILTLEHLGAQVEIFPLLREKTTVMHPEAQRILPRVRFQPFFSLDILKALFYYLLRRPWSLSQTFFELAFGTISSPKFFIRALSIFPKSLRFAYEMERLDIQHVHAHFATHPTVAALIIHRLTGIPFSFTAHGSDLHKDQTMLRQKIQASAFVATISDYNRNFILEKAGADLLSKIQLVRCGIDPAIFQVKPASEPAPAAPLEILCVASLREVKGHAYLVEACALLRRRGIDFRCRLVGDGPRRAEIEEQVERLQLTGQVICYGAQPRPVVVEMMQKADVATLTSILGSHGEREGIPVVLMEAMACALPVVASRISGIPELVIHNHSGLLASPKDAAGLADAFAVLANNPQQRQQFGQAGRLHVLQHYHLQENTRQLGRLFQKGAAAG